MFFFLQKIRSPQKTGGFHTQKNETTWARSVPRSVCTSSKLETTNPWSLAPKVVLKQHPCRRQGSSWWIFVDFVWGAGWMLGKHPLWVGVYERGVGLLDHLSFWTTNFVYFLNSFELHLGLLQLPSLISFDSHTIDSTLAPQVSFHRSWAIQKWERTVTNGVKYPQLPMDIRPCIGAPMSLQFVASERGPTLKRTQYYEQISERMSSFFARFGVRQSLETWKFDQIFES